MKKWKFVAAALLSAAVLAPTLAGAADLGVYPRRAASHGDHYWYGLPYPISFKHNYGPGYVPGTFAFYDGPSTNHCYQGSAAYLGQDRRRHPCF
jgi:hypothetical protein